MYGNCRAFLTPAREDFGIAPFEAMARGRPVTAFGRGGAADTVVGSVTHVLYGEQTSKALRTAVTSFDAGRYDVQVIRNHALRFSKVLFKEKINDFIIASYEDYRRNDGPRRQEEPVGPAEFSEEIMMPAV